MRLVRAEEDQFVFETGTRERSLFREVLKNFPLIPSSHHRLSRGPQAEDKAEDQELLEEALAANKQDQKSRVEAFLADSQRFVAHGRSQRVTFRREEMEWLLQVLNDVRVGSWIALGCPDPDEAKPPVVNESNTRFVFLMELSGHFQCVLLDALHRAG
jgi:hypothetical protein